MHTAPRRSVLPFFLVFLSGFSALIYQVVWHRYLALLFGAQATASALCLAVFLGGMGLGYRLFGRLSYQRGRDLLRVFAYLEFGLAIWATLFPYFFRLGLQAVSLVSPVLGPFGVTLDFLLAVALLAPPTILMGGTLPVLTQGLSESVNLSSQIHARIYGWNTLGAFLGALIGGYFLLPYLSYPQSLFVGALGNLTVGISALIRYPSLPTVARRQARFRPELPSRAYPLLVVAFISGFSLFALQTICMRLLALASGASYYSYSLVVAIFIAWLGWGSLSLGAKEHKPRALAWNQVGVALGFLFVLYSINYWSYVTHVIRVSLQSHWVSFYFYQFLIALALFLTLGPALLFGGRTLPLSFHLLRDQKETLGESVGHIYFWNTIGSITGALIGGYLLLLWVNLDTVIRIATALIGISVFVSFRMASINPGPFRPAPSLVLSGIILMGAFGLPDFIPERYVQAFRQQTVGETSFKGPRAHGEYLGRAAKLLVWKDGPSASIAVGAFPLSGEEQSRTLFVNGKSDGNTQGDALTTLLLGQIPGLLAPRLEKTFIVGFGTGMTVAALADFPESQQIEVAEISETLLNHAELFDPYNGGVTRNSKVKLFSTDGFRHLLESSSQYDLIISEPSNPWTAGVENVYTAEFYEAARKKLHPEGMLVQWVNTYAFDPPLMRTVFRTLTGVFPFVRVFQLHTGDIALVAMSRDFNSADLERASRRLAEPAVNRAMSYVGIQTLEAFLALERITPQGAKALALGGELHRMEDPRLSFCAARAHFMREQVDIASLRQETREYFLSVKDSLLLRFRNGRPLDQSSLSELERTFCIHTVARQAGLCDEVSIALNPSPAPQRHWLGQDAIRRDLYSIWQSDSVGIERLDAFKRFYSPIFYPTKDQVLGNVNRCVLTARKGNDERREGECLIQRLAYLDFFATSPTEIFQAGTEYLQWFRRVDPNQPYYGQFRDASEAVSAALLRLS